jgi:hypothetical protein
MLSGFKASVQNELDAFFPQLNNQADLAQSSQLKPKTS